MLLVDKMHSPEIIIGSVLLLGEMQLSLWPFRGAAAQYINRSTDRSCDDAKKSGNASKNDLKLFSSLWFRHFSPALLPIVLSILSDLLHVCVFLSCVQALLKSAKLHNSRRQFSSIDQTLQIISSQIAPSSLNFIALFSSLMRSFVSSHTPIAVTSQVDDCTTEPISIQK